MIDTSDLKTRLRRFLPDGLILGLLLVIPFFPLWLIVSKLSYIAYNNSSDTFLYVDIARNILAGRGPVTSFNVYQYWTGTFYPALPFVHVGLSYVLALCYAFFPSIQALIQLNFVFAFLNCYLVFRIAQKLYSDKTLAYWVALLVAATVSMEITLLRILTEQMSLLITLAAVLCFLTTKCFSRRRIAVLGGLLALGVLVRSASIVYLLAFFLAFWFNPDDPRRRQNAMTLLFWSCGIVIAYMLAVFLKFHAVFPEYPRAFKNYYLATFGAGGGFTSGVPAIAPLPPEKPFSYVMINVMEMGRVLFCLLRVLVIFVLVRLFKVFKTKDRVEMLVVWLVVVQVVSLIVFYDYMRIGEFSWTRFLLLPVTCLFVLGVKGLRDFSHRYFPRTHFFLFHGILLTVFFSNFYQSAKTLEVYWQEAKTGKKVVRLSSIAEWVKTNTSPSDLVAVSEYIIGNVYLERPAIVLPLFKMLTTTNLRDFCAIFKPRAIIFEKTLPLVPALEALGYRQPKNILPDDFFVVLEKP